MPKINCKTIHVITCAWSRARSAIPRASLINCRTVHACSTDLSEYLAIECQTGGAIRGDPGPVPESKVSRIELESTRYQVQMV